MPTDNALRHCPYCQDNKLCKRASPDAPYFCVKCGSTITTPLQVSEKKTRQTRKAKRAMPVVMRGA